MNCLQSEEPKTYFPALLGLQLELDHQAMRMAGLSEREIVRHDLRIGFIEAGWTWCTPPKHRKRGGDRV